MVSHQFSRMFQPAQLHKPRGFVLPSLPQATPLFLEIGAGKGMHAMGYARNNRQHFIIAIERTKEKYTAFQKVILDSDTNLQAVHADAIAWSVFALPPNSLDGVFLLYPNPERNNANQRWLNMPFFEFLLSRMKLNASIVLASNIENYMDEAQQQCEQVWCLDYQFERLPTHIQRTHFERKYQQRAEACWQLTMTKQTGYATHFDDVNFAHSDEG